jgi:hypothetical protein
LLPPLTRTQVVADELQEQLMQSDPVRHALTPEERSAVREALARAMRGGFADEADADVMLRQPWG